MYFLDKEIKTLMDEYEELPLSKYVERVIQIHHRMTGQYDMLYERFFKSILSSFAALSDFRM